MEPPFGLKLYSEGEMPEHRLEVGLDGLSSFLVRVVAAVPVRLNVLTASDAQKAANEMELVCRDYVVERTNVPRWALGSDIRIAELGLHNWACDVLFYVADPTPRLQTMPMTVRLSPSAQAFPTETDAMHYVTGQDLLRWRRSLRNQLPAAEPPPCLNCHRPFTSCICNGFPGAGAG